MRAPVGRAWRAVWNWKSALASALLRAPLFFAANLSAGVGAAALAFVTEFAYRVAGAGFYGSLTEAFARSRWRYAPAAALVVLPAIGHSAEYVVHLWAGTPELGRSIAASVALSVATTTFSLAVMRHGLFLATSDQSFWADVRAVYRLARRASGWLLGRGQRVASGLRSSPSGS